MASVNTQFSIAVHVLAAIAHYERAFTSEILAGSVNANPVFVKRILVKLSKAELVKSTVGKSGGYDLARSPKSISLLDIYSAVNPPNALLKASSTDLHELWQLCQLLSSAILRAFRWSVIGYGLSAFSGQ